MKISSVMLGFIFILLAFIIVPISLIEFNINHKLPIYNFLLFKITGAVFVIIGIFVCLYCVSLFFKFGKGTPVPIDPPKKLVIRGLYKYSRNPMYVGYMISILGEFFFFGHLLLLFYFFTVMVIVHLFVVFYEEPILKKRFGKSYEKYLKKTPRWLF